MVVVADAGPLIGLARVHRLDLLPRLYGSGLIPPAVYDELQVSSGRPGTVQLKSAFERRWLRVHDLPPSADASSAELMLILDAGETEAILVAEQVSCRLLLIDDRRGRHIAKRRGIPVAGVAGVLLAAKQHGLINGVLPVLKELARQGYRLSPELANTIAGLAGEAND